MNMSCSTRMIKYLMFAFNLCFVISGIIIIAVGAAVKAKYSDYSYFLDTKYFSLPNMLIATGALILIISFFGCCGAMKESWIMLGLFTIFLCIIFIFEFSAGIAGYVLRGKTIDYLDKTLKNNLKTYNGSSDTIWDLIQRNFQCCGVDSYHDWNGTFTDQYALPISCCPLETGVSGAFYCNSYIPTTTEGTTTSEISSTSDTTTTKTTAPPPTTPTTAPPPTTPTTAPPPTTPTTAPPPTTPTTAPPPTTPTIAPPPTSTTIASPTTPVTSSSDATSSITTTDKSSSTNVTTPLPKLESRRKRQLPMDSGPDAKTNTTTTVTPSPSTSQPYATGCKTAFGKYIKSHAVQIGGCAMALAVIQVIGIVFAVHLVRQLKNGYLST